MYSTTTERGPARPRPWWGLSCAANLAVVRGAPACAKFHGRADRAWGPPNANDLGQLHPRSRSRTRPTYPATTTTRQQNWEKYTEQLHSDLPAHQAAGDTGRPNSA